MFGMGVFGNGSEAAADAAPAAASKPSDSGAAGGRSGSRPPVMSAVERQLNKQMIEERQERKQADEALREELMGSIEQIHAKMDDPLLAKLEQPPAPAVGSKDVEALRSELTETRTQLEELKAKMGAFEKIAVTESFVHALLAERLEMARQSTQRNLDEGLELIRSTQKLQLDGMEANQARLRNGLDELAGIMVSGNAPKSLAFSNGSVGAPVMSGPLPSGSGMQKLEEMQLLRQLSAQVKDLEKTHKDFVAHPSIAAAAKADNTEVAAREISNMVSELVQNLKVDVERHEQYINSNVNQIKSLDAAIFDMQSKQTLTAVRATKLALRSAELSESNRAQALASLEAREKSVKADIDKIQAERENGALLSTAALATVQSEQQAALSTPRGMGSGSPAEDSGQLQPSPPLSTQRQPEGQLQPSAV